MAVDVVMPQMGESIFEGTITKWLKKPGDKVERDEPLFEISTDKVDAEIPSPSAGVLKEIKIPEGQTVPIQTIVAVIDGAGGAASSAPAPTPAQAAAPAAAKPAAPAPAAATPAPAAAAAAPAPAASAGPVAQIPDEPVKAVDIVHTVVAQKLKKTLEEVSASKAIKDLVGGKSTMQVQSLSKT